MYCPNCGKEILENASVCLGCGCAAPKSAKSVAADSTSVGWWWLGFFFPLVGFILWLVLTDSTPVRAKRVGMGALVGVIVSAVLVVLVYVAIFVLSFLIGMSSAMYI